MYNHFYILIIKFIGLKLLYLFFIRKIHMQILKNFQNFQNNLNKYPSKVSSVKTLVE
jgi:nitrogen fixation/metabolism regulation signal transduction histidine kinase